LAMEDSHIVQEVDEEESGSCIYCNGDLTAIRCTVESGSMFFSGAAACW